MAPAHIIRSPSNYISQNWSGGGFSYESREALSSSSGGRADTPPDRGENAASAADNPERVVSGLEERLEADSVVAKERIREQIENANKPPAYVAVPPPNSIAQMAKEQAVIYAAQQYSQVEANVDQAKEYMAIAEMVWAFDVTVASTVADVSGASFLAKFAAKEAGEHGIPEVEKLVGFVLDDYAKQQTAKLEAGIDGAMGAAKEIISNPEGVLKAIADGYMAELEYSATLRMAYETGHADLGALFEAERISCKVKRELAVLGIEVAALAVGGAGLLLKGLRAAGVAGKLSKTGNAAPLATIIAAGDNAKKATDALEKLMTSPNRAGQISLDDINRLTPDHPMGSDGQIITRENDRGFSITQPPGGKTCVQHACAIALDTMGKRVDVEEITKVYPSLQGAGLGLDKSTEILKAHGIKSTTRIGQSISDLQRMTSDGRPAIAIVETYDGKYHAVVVDGITTRGGQQVVAIRDPGGRASSGNYYETVESFQGRFPGYVIEIEGLAD